MKQTPHLAPATDPLVVELWPGPVPGDAGIEGQEKSRIHATELVGNTRLITNVTRPSLTVCRPPAEKNTGTAMLICPGGGYHDLYWELEGEEVVAWLNSQGMAGIILSGPCQRRQHLRGRPQRDHVPGVTASRGPGRTARLRHRRARLWGAPQRQAALQLAPALPQLAAQQGSAFGTHTLTVIAATPWSHHTFAAAARGAHKCRGRPTAERPTV
jgi:hypothetical protein